MRAIIVLLGAMMLSGQAAASNICHGANGKWNFGGVSFDADASSLSQADCSSFCTLTAPDGITYVVSSSSKTKPHVVKKARALRPGEALPFGVVASDTPDAVFAKIKAAGGDAGYARGDVGIKGAGMFCKEDKGYPYILLFMADQKGQITGISETPDLGWFYVDDSTESFD